jgi:hypothetical protein
MRRMCGVGRSILPLQLVPEVPGSRRRDSRHLRSAQAGAAGVTDRHVQGRSSQNRAPPLRSCRPFSHHAPTRLFLRGVPLRETGHSRPSRATLTTRDRLLPCVWRPAALLGFLRPSQVCSRRWVSRRFRRSGPTCRLVVARPARLIFVGLDRIAWWRRPIQDCQRDVRLLGFAPVCDPHPAAF